jgi:hypothetical protein
MELKECPACGAEPEYREDTRDEVDADGHRHLYYEAVPFCMNDDCRYRGMSFARIEEAQVKADTQQEAVK